MGFPQIGPFELIILLVIVLLIFGPGKLPQLGQQLGKGIRQFRKAQSEMDPREAAPKPVSAPVAETTAPTTSTAPVSAPTSPDGTPPTMPRA